MIRWILTLLPLAAIAQPQARIVLDSNQVETGNPFLIHLQVSPVGKAPDTLNWLAWNHSIPPANRLNISGWRRADQWLQKDLTVIFFDADTLWLEPLPLPLTPGDTAWTDSVMVIVYPSPAPSDLNDMQPIKDIIREPARWTDYLPWILGVAAVLLVLWLLNHLYTRRSKTSLISRQMALSAHELALKKLEQLERQSWWVRGDVKAFCTEWSYIIREYLENRYHIPALESTTTELLSRLEGTDFPATFRDGLSQFLVQSDLAKFAKGIPDAGFDQASVLFARQLIEATRPQNGTAVTQA